MLDKPGYPNVVRVCWEHLGGEREVCLNCYHSDPEKQKIDGWAFFLPYLNLFIPVKLHEPLIYILSQTNKIDLT